MDRPVNHTRSARSPTSLSVVIPTRARTTRLLLTLAALREQRLPEGRFDVVLVNDAPDRRVVDEVLAVLPDGLRLQVADSGGRGVAHARNVGAELAQEDLLFFLDDDTVAAPGLLAAHLAAHAEAVRSRTPGHQPGAPPPNGGTASGGVVHGRITDLSAFTLTPEPEVLAARLVGARGRSIGPSEAADLSREAPRFGPRRSFIERVARKAVETPEYRALAWLSCVGTNTSLWRADFERAGRFDASYGTLWGGEDLELGLRLAASGCSFQMIDATGYHLPTARRRVTETLPRFWRLVAERHGDPALERVGAFLLGRMELAELAALLSHRVPRPHTSPATPHDPEQATGTGQTPRTGRTADAGQATEQATGQATGSGRPAAPDRSRAANPARTPAGWAAAPLPTPNGAARPGTTG
ncbi:glycosyltransferase [Streptomyces sp. AJS327]|uniref:glycosyltransferase n=1 Tax=Streptomyces sp. AJS327 TaxID=2545265 RepID=UPI0015DFD282|nr:glycosyltransferase [Streptomyces sp. AJS327]MBA0052901.1 glycosyltransferase [Streptomyces sp. AJS327]